MGDAEYGACRIMTAGRKITARAGLLTDKSNCPAALARLVPDGT